MLHYNIWYLCLSSKLTLLKHFIFRILRLSSTRVLEVYPGDGSVIVSQGVKGLYYKHIIPYGDRVWNGQLDFMCRIWISCEDFFIMCRILLFLPINFVSSGITFNELF